MARPARPDSLNPSISETRPKASKSETRFASAPAKNRQRVVPRHLIFRQGSHTDEADAAVLRVKRDEREKVAYLAALEKIAKVKERNAELFQHGGHAGERKVGTRQNGLIGVWDPAAAKPFDGIPDGLSFGGEGRSDGESHLTGMTAAAASSACAVSSRRQPLAGSPCRSVPRTLTA